MKARHDGKCQPQSKMHVNNNEENKKPLQATRGVFLSCSPKEHNEFTMVMAKAQMEKSILKFRTPKP